MSAKPTDHRPAAADSHRLGSFSHTCLGRERAVRERAVKTLDEVDPATNPALADPAALQLGAALTTLWEITTSTRQLAGLLFEICDHDLPTARSALDDWVKHLALDRPAIRASLDTYVIALGELERLARDR